MFATDFENGTVEGWMASGGGLSTDVAASGTHSLKVTSSRYAGALAAIDIPGSRLQAGRWYQYRVAVRLAAGQPRTSMTARVLGAAPIPTYVDDGGWVVLSGQFPYDGTATPGTGSGGTGADIRLTVTETRRCAAGPDPPAWEFLLDDLRVTTMATSWGAWPLPQPTWTCPAVTTTTSTGPVLVSDFEDGTAQGCWPWRGPRRGDGGGRQ